MNTKVHEKSNLASVKTPIINQIEEYLTGKYAFRLNIVSNTIEYRTQEESTWQELNESNLTCELYKVGFSRFKDPFQALLKSDFIPPYDPIIEYFENLPAWNASQPDHIGKLAEYVVAKDQEWFNLMFRKMLVRAVACGIGYISFNKQCFVLVGRQNDGKTSFLRSLCPPALSSYIKENIEFENKDGRIALAENLFINLDELSSFSKTDINRAKAFFTEDKIKVRRPYDRKDTVAKRRASFLASTNQKEFLTDETGNVRWLVMEIDYIHHDNGGPTGYAANVDMNKVWAQAYALLKSGYSFNLTKEELLKSERNNLNHQRTTTETELLLQYFEESGKDEAGAEFVTTTELVRRLTTLTQGQLRLNSNNVGKALSVLKYNQVSNRPAYASYPIKGYFVRQIG